MRDGEIFTLVVPRWNTATWKTRMCVCVCVLEGTISVTLQHITPCFSQENKRNLSVVMEIYSHFSLAPSVESRGKAAGMRCGPGDMGRWQRAAAAIDLPSVLPAHFWKSSKLLHNTYLIFYFPPPFCSQGPRRSGRQILCCMHNLWNVWIPITVTYCVGKFNSTRWSVGSYSAFIYAIVINSPGARLTPVWHHFRFRWSARIIFCWWFVVRLHRNGMKKWNVL